MSGRITVAITVRVSICVARKASVSVRVTIMHSGLLGPQVDI